MAERLGAMSAGFDASHNMGTVAACCSAPSAAGRGVVGKKLGVFWAVCFFCDGIAGEACLAAASLMLEG